MSVAEIRTSDLGTDAGPSASPPTGEQAMSTCRQMHHNGGLAFASESET